MNIIDRDKLMQNISKEYAYHSKLFNDCGDRERGGVVKGILYAEQIIGNQTILNLDMRKSGNWEDIRFSVGEYQDCTGAREISIVSGRCSKCGRYSYDINHYCPEMPEFCSHCGAEMRKEEVIL